MGKAISVMEADGVATITITRAERGNAIDLETYGAMCEALSAAGADPAVDVIVLGGAGADFSVGEDMEFLATLQATGRLKDWDAGYRGWVPVTWHNPKMIVASVRGRAFGIGCELALLADVTFASPEATFGHPETAHGIVTPTIWPWLAGPKVAKEFLASGLSMSAEHAHRAGLINRVVPAADLDASVAAFARDLVSMPKGTPTANKHRINWAFRDVSRVLHDDRFYDVDFDWVLWSRGVDQSFYRSVSDRGVHGALRKRDDSFTA